MTSVEVDLRVMATSDLHMHILPYDYAADREAPGIGLARTAALIRAARRERGNTILVDNGDFLNGTPLGDELARAARRGGRARGTHPVAAAMAKLGYDALTLGNHDFDHGADYLGRVLAQLRAPVVCSNVALRPADAAGRATPLPFVRPYALLDRIVRDGAGRDHPLRIGVLGFLPPGSITGLRSGPFRAETHDIVDRARSMVLPLRAAGADLVLALAHSGIGAPDHEERMENAVVPLAAIDGIDAIVAGHDHQVFPAPGRWPPQADPQRGTIHGTPVVAPGFWGSHLGIIDLKLARDLGGRWRITGARSEARPIAVPDPETGAPQPQGRPDPTIARIVGALHERTLGEIRRPVGETKRHLHSFFALVAPSPAIDLVHRAKAWYAGREIAGTPLAGLPLVVSAAPLRAGGLAGPGYFTDIPPGPITLRAVADLYPYPNDLCAVRLTGAELADWLERAAGVFNRVAPHRAEQTLIEPATPAYLFETVAGADYEIDLAAPARYGPDGRLLDAAAGRVRGLRLDGAPLAPDREVLLVTTSYRLSGGGGYPLAGRERAALDLPVSLRDVIVEYLAAAGPVDGRPRATWRFTPVDGASVRFASAPAAAAFLAEIEDRDISAGEVGEDGFMRFRMAL